MVEHTLGHILAKNRDKFQTPDLRLSQSRSIPQVRHRPVKDQSLERKLVSRQRRESYDFHVEVKQRDPEVQNRHKSALLMDLIKKN